MSLRHRVLKFYDPKESPARRGARVSIPAIRRNNRYFDPVLIFNGDSTPDANYGAIFSNTDASYVGTQPFFPGAAMGKTAAGNVFKLFWNTSAGANTVVWGSDGSFPALSMAGGTQWRFPAAATVSTNPPLGPSYAIFGVFPRQDWVHSVVCVNQGGFAVGIQLGVRWTLASLSPGGSGAFITDSAIIYSPTLGFSAIANQSLAVMWSAPLAGDVVCSGEHIWGEYFMKITTGSSKSGAVVGMRTNG